MDLTEIFKKVVEHKAPDVHLKTGKPPVVRLGNGDVQVLDNFSPLTAENILQVGEKIAGAQNYKIFEDKKEIDFSCSLPDIGRFRVNFYHDSNGPALAFRVIAEKIPAFSELGLPEVMKKLAVLPRGLILVTGPTGSGKSTTLAALIEFINQNRKVHIITIEDPIEYIFKPAAALMTQREVKVHTNSFTSAIRSALRQNPDVVMVGEMRDLETIAAAITLAETGHLVLSTLHTVDAVQTVDRIIDVFPAYQQQQIRAQLSACLEAVVSQTLVTRKDGLGRAAAFEIMLGNEAVRNSLKEGKTSQLYSILQMHREHGMQTLDDSLAALVKNGAINKEDAFSKAHDIETLRRELEGA